MTCPNCGARVIDPDGAFCSRCGAALSSGDTEVTARVDPRPDVAGKAAAAGKRSISMWLDPVGAACLAFLMLLSLGALLLIAAKLQYPGFGAGADPIDVLSAITILGLAILRVPVHVDDLVVSVLPLGALVAAGLGIAWATSITFRDRGDRGAWAGAAVGVPFAVICWVAALVFRFEGRNEVFSGAWGALSWGLVWGCLFGAIGGARSRADRKRLSAVVTESDGRGPVRRGMVAAGVAVGVCTALAGAVVLLWVIVGLVRGVPGPKFGAADAAAGFVYLLAFAPNLVAILTASGMGAPVYVGARVTVAGAGIGDIERVWLFGDAPGYMFLLPLIPLVACASAGFWARRVSPPKEVAVVLAAFAATFALALALLAWLGEARLGAGLLGRGLARLDVNAVATFLLGLVWAGSAGFAGWLVADLKRGADPV